MTAAAFIQEVQARIAVADSLAGKPKERGQHGARRPTYRASIDGVIKVLEKCLYRHVTST